MVVETMLGIALVVGVIGLILVLDCLLSRVSFPTPGVTRVTVLVCEGDAERLEGVLRDARRRCAQVYIFDSGMSPEGSRRARLLALRYGATYTNGKDFTKELESFHGRE